MNLRSQAENITDILILGFLLVFLAVFLDIRYLFTDTIVTGGDMASWYGVAHHMREVLLPDGRLMGWDMGNFGGYPSFNFYFIPPFLMAVLPSVLFGIPLTITLKIAIAGGVFMLPVSTYFGLRAMDYRFPAPVIGACASLLFLFNETYTMFGGNILSTYAGEFCYMFAFALLPWFMGSLFKGVATGTGAIKNGLILGLIGLSHLFVFIPSVFLIIYWYFARGRLGYLIRVSLVAFGIMAFWILPLIAYRNPYTVPVYIIWNEFLNWRYTLAGLGLIALITVPYIIPMIFGRFLKRDSRFRALGSGLAMICFLFLSTLAFFGLYRMVSGALTDDSLSAFFNHPLTVVSVCGVFVLISGSILSRSKTIKAAVRDMMSDKGPRTFGMYMGLIFGCVVTYFAAHFLKIPDIRFLPPILFVLLLIFFAHTLGQFLGKSRLRSRIFGAVTICLLCVVVVVFGSRLSGHWFRFNNAGYESTPGYPDFKALADYLRTSGGNDPLNAPRVGYEKCDLYNIYGGDRVFESIPVFSGRQTLEGIHYSSSMASSFIAFLQTEFSRDVKTPNAGILSRINPQALKTHLNLYNISQLIVMTDEAKKALVDSRMFEREARFGGLYIYRYLESDNRYVDVPEVRPVIYKGDDWIRPFYRWFKRPDNPPVLLIPDSFIRNKADRSVFDRITDTVLDLDQFKDDVLDRKDLHIDAHLAHLKIRFTTNKIGVPHLIKVSYFPNWRVSGANGIYPVSPHFMMVIPRQETVVLTYGRAFWEIAGWTVTGFTILVLLTIGISRNISPDGIRLSNRPMLRFFYGFEDRLNRLRPYLLIALFLSCTILTLSGIVLRNRPVKAYTRGVISYQTGMELLKVHRTEAASTAFEDAIRGMEAFLDDRKTIDHRDIINCMLHTAMCYERLGKWDRAERWYRTLISEYPYCRQLGEAYVKIARIKKQGGRRRLTKGLKRISDRSDGRDLVRQAVRQTEESIGYFQTAMEKDPYSIWATYAREDLKREKEFLNGLKPTIFTVFKADELPKFIPKAIDRNRNSVVTVHLDATSGWLDTRLNVKTGETIRIAARSVWAAAPLEVRDTWPDAGPEGHGNHPAEQVFKHLDSQKELPGTAFGALLGRIGDHIFAIGDRNDIIIPQSGRLLLVMNDLPGQRFDNRGGLEIRIEFGDGQKVEGEGYKKASLRLCGELLQIL